MRSLDYSSLLTEILGRYRNPSKWDGSVFERIKHISNTQVGDVGQDFISEVCRRSGLRLELPTTEEGQPRRQNPWDMKINGVTFEVKTATEDVKNAFQFNHVRYHRQYDALLCVGISPNSICFDAWLKSTVATGGAGHLVTMDKGSSATWKLTKRATQLRPIAEFEQHIAALTKAAPVGPNKQ